MIFLTYDIHLLFLATSIGWVLARLIRFAIQKRGSLTRELTLVILFLFLWFLIRHTMEPYILTLDRSPLPPNLVPLRGLAQMLRRAMMVGNSITWWIVAINIIGNVVGFVPVGFLVSVLTPNRHKGWIALAIGFAVSLTIEILQLSFVIRVFDVDDLLLNSLGAWFGFLIFLLLNEFKQPREAFARTAKAQRPGAWRFVLLYGAFAVAAAAVIYWIDYAAYLQIPQ